MIVCFTTLHQNALSIAEVAGCFTTLPQNALHIAEVVGCFTTLPQNALHLVGWINLKRYARHFFLELARFRSQLYGVKAIAERQNVKKDTR